MNKKIYIAGPMRGIYYFNRGAFDVAERLLAEEGWKPINPHTLDEEAGFDLAQEVWTYGVSSKKYHGNPAENIWPETEAHILTNCFDMKAAIKRDVEAIAECDAIYLLKGWQNSKGACAERAIAEWHGLEIIEQKTGEELQKPLIPGHNSDNALKPTPSHTFDAHNHTAVATVAKDPSATSFSRDDLIKLAEDFSRIEIEVMKKKNADYTAKADGSDPFANFRNSAIVGVPAELGILLRVIDKIMRIKAFVENGELQVKDESVMDAIHDIRNYMILLAGMVKESEVEG